MRLFGDDGYLRPNVQVVLGAILAVFLMGFTILRPNPQSVFSSGYCSSWAFLDGFTPHGMGIAKLGRTKRHGEMYQSKRDTIQMLCNFSWGRRGNRRTRDLYRWLG